ncbi:MAG: hypothetical protein AAGJ87_04195 [Pseudomonadota bacterium]
MKIGGACPRLSFVAALSLISAACASTPETERAVLVDDQPSTIIALKSSIAAAMGVARVELGAGDPTREPFVIVLPPRLGPEETRSTVTPNVFDIVRVNDACMLVDRKTGRRFPLDAPCRPI